MSELKKVNTRSANNAAFFKSSPVDGSKRPMSEKRAASMFIRKFLKPRKQVSRMKSDMTAEMSCEISPDVSEHVDNERILVKLIASDRDQVSLSQRSVTSVNSTVPITVTPLATYESILAEKDIIKQTFLAVQTGYYNKKPSSLQLASYSNHVVKLCLNGPVSKFEAVMEAGLSPNACSAKGDSLLHLACREGNVASFNTLIKLGATVRICNAHGRTLLHEACSGEPCFEIVLSLLQADLCLLDLEDFDGRTPLDCIPEQKWAAWNEFLDQHQELLSSRSGTTCQLARSPSDSRLIRNPTKSLTHELARMVSNGKIEPFEAHFLMYDGEDFESDDENDQDEENSKKAADSHSRQNDKAYGQFCEFDDDDVDCNDNEDVNHASFCSHSSDGSDFSFGEILAGLTPAHPPKNNMLSSGKVVFNVKTDE